MQVEPNNTVRATIFLVEFSQIINIGVLLPFSLLLVLIIFQPNLLDYISKAKSCLHEIWRQLLIKKKNDPIIVN